MTRALILAVLLWGLTAPAALAHSKAGDPAHTHTDTDKGRR